MEPLKRLYFFGRAFVGVWGACGVKKARYPKAAPIPLCMGGQRTETPAALCCRLQQRLFGQLNPLTNTDARLVVVLLLRAVGLDLDQESLGRVVRW